MSAVHATLATDGWLALIRQGLSPCKTHQASLGALTPHFSGQTSAVAGRTKPDATPKYYSGHVCRNYRARVWSRCKCLLALFLLQHFQFSLSSSAFPHLHAPILFGFFGILLSHGQRCQVLNWPPGVFPEYVNRQTFCADSATSAWRNATITNISPEHHVIIHRASRYREAQQS